MREPILIGGNPRSGTAFVARLLDKHPDIVVTSELNPDAAELGIRMLELLDVHMGRSPRRWEYWARNRPQLMRQMWLSVSADPIHQRKPADARLGHKTPGCELLFERYVRIFEPDHPKLVYCMRDAPDVLRSLVNMPWRPVPFEERLALLKRSVVTFEDLSARYPDHVFLVQIDRMPQDPDARVESMRPLFDFVGEPFEKLVERFVREWRRINAQSDIAGQAPPKDLTDQQRALVDGDEEIQAIRHRYGYARAAQRRRWRRAGKRRP